VPWGDGPWPGATSWCAALPPLQALPRNPPLCSSPRLPPPPKVVADPLGQHWLLLATDRGHLLLWDVRFLLRVNSWQHPSK
jgi:hypothetical protein